MLGQPFTPPAPCDCGHDMAFHASARSTWPHEPTRGVCTVPGCDCREYTTGGGKDDPNHGMEALDSDPMDRRAA